MRTTRLVSEFVHNMHHSGEVLKQQGDLSTVCSEILKCRMMLADRLEQFGHAWIRVVGDGVGIAHREKESVQRSMNPIDRTRRALGLDQCFRVRQGRFDGLRADLQRWLSNWGGRKADDEREHVRMLVLQPSGDLVVFQQRIQVARVFLEDMLNCVEDVPPTVSFVPSVELPDRWLDRRSAASRARPLFRLCPSTSRAARRLQRLVSRP